ncbi:hypothetical protein Peur_054350 [Populus x canadensis]
MSWALSCWFIHVWLWLCSVMSSSVAGAAPSHGKEMVDCDQIAADPAPIRRTATLELRPSLLLSDIVAIGKLSASVQKKQGKEKR